MNRSRVAVHAVHAVATGDLALLEVLGVESTIMALIGVEAVQVPIGAGFGHW